MSQCDTFRLYLCRGKTEFSSGHFVHLILFRTVDTTKNQDANLNLDAVSQVSSVPMSRGNAVEIKGKLFAFDVSLLPMSVGN